MTTTAGGDDFTDDHEDSVEAKECHEHEGHEFEELIATKIYAKALLCGCVLGVAAFQAYFKLMVTT